LPHLAEPLFCSIQRPNLVEVRRLRSGCRFQLTANDIAIIVLLKQQWPDVRRHVHLVVAAINAATPGSYSEVEIP
jgi:hypothetical protein